jgi:predicted MFS family arabinose efflux permease
MAAVVYGFIRTASNGWSDSLAIGSLVAGVVLLGAFVRIETGSAQPITPLRMFTNRIRAGSYVIMLLMTGALFGMFYFVVQFIENVLGYGPVKTGFAFLPVPVLVAAAAGICTQALPRIGPRPILVAGAAIATGGMAWLTQLSATGGYAQQVLGPMAMIGFGVGLLVVPLTVLAVSNVAPDEAGAASSLLNVMQQIGSALGLSILVTMFGAASRDTAKHPLAGASPVAEAHYVLTHSMGISFIVATVFLGCTILLAAIVVNAKVSDVSQVSAEAPADALG